MYVWKVLHGVVHNPGLELRKDEPMQHRHGLKFTVPRVTSKLRENSFLVRGPKLFNSLPKDLREFQFDSTVRQQQAIDNFKRALDEYLSLMPDEPSVRSEYTKYMTGSTPYGDVTNSIIRQV